MNKARGLSIITITLLIFQLFSVSFGTVSISQAAKDSDGAKVEVNNISADDNTLIWEVTVNASGDEMQTAKTKITLSAGQSHKAINHSDEITTKQTKSGYEIETPVDGVTHSVKITTEITEEAKEIFNVNAKVEVEGSSSTDEAEVQVKKTETNKETKEQSKDGDGKNEKESNANNPNENKSNEEETTEEVDENLEDEYVSVERYGKQYSPAAVPFSVFNELQVEEARATHKIETTTSDNICLRELEGEIDFTLPAPEEKTPVDIVVVQDASGSYGGNANQARQSLRDIVDMLDLSQDRMMVTSYRGYHGWSSYNSVGDFDAGNVRDTSNRGRNEQGLTLTLHTGLSNNASALKNGINQIAFDGATPTASGLQYAKEQYEAAIAGQDLTDRNTVFILITDGVANAMLDGNIHIEYNGGFFNPHSWAERYQFHERTFSEVLSVADSIKSQNYTMVSAYWENKTVLRQGYPNYDAVIGPAARQMVKEVASSPDLYNANEDLAQAMADLLDNLQTTLNEYTGFKTDFDIAPGFELVPNSIQVNGNQADYTVSGNTVTVTADKIPSGENILTYKLKESAVHGNTKTPVSNGTIYYDKNNGSFTSSVAIPEVTLSGNENSEHCITDIVKSVAKDGSNEFDDGIELDGMNESFTYKLEYQFGEEIEEASSVQLKDQLEAVLEFVGDVDSIDVDANIANLSYNTTLLNDNKGFIIDLDKQNNTYHYLAGKKITISFQAKIKDGVTSDDLANYRELGVPNEATLLIDDEPEPSNEVYVQPPKFGTIKIIKVDANEEEIKLAGAKFAVKDVDGNTVDTLVTDDSGTTTSKELLAGDYTLVELEAPTGYEVLLKDVSVTLEAGMEVTEKIKNDRSTGKVTINKVDEENEPLKAAEFTLTGPNGFTETKTSNSEGEIAFDNLEWGTYTLKETKAPEGYRLLKKEITIEINKDQLTFEKTIENSETGWNIPDTGGIGSLGFFSAGLLIMVGAGLSLLRRRQIS